MGRAGRAREPRRKVAGQQVLAAAAAAAAAIVAATTIAMGPSGTGLKSGETFARQRTQSKAAERAAPHRTAAPTRCFRDTRL